MLCWVGLDPFKSSALVLAKRCVYYITFHVCFSKAHKFTSLPHRSYPGCIPSTTHKYTPIAQRPPHSLPHTSLATSSKSDSQSQKRGKVVSMSNDGMDVQAVLERLLDSGGGDGNEEKERERGRKREHQPAPPQRRVPSPTRDEPPLTSTTAQCAERYKERVRERAA